MLGTVVGVLRGGPSKEHEVSLLTGHSIVSNLSPERYTVRDIYIDRDGTWHERGKPVAPDRILRAVDVVVIGLHGEYGEDGEIQKLLERYGVPYTGSDSFGSYMAMHKVMAKEKARELGIRTPRYHFIQPGMDVPGIAQEINRSYLQPVIVKPLRAGSSVGVSLAHGYAPLLQAINELLEDSDGVIVEEYIRGKEATVGIVQNLRGEHLYALPLIEILPPQGDFFSYDAKYSGATREIVPAQFPKATADELVRVSRAMHEALGLRHYSRSDFMISPKGVYYLETNTLPGLTNESLLPKSLAAVGVTIPDFLSHIIDLALRK